MKIKRQSKILELLENFNIETQEELCVKLKEQGFEVTQATISRDIKELKLIKILTDSGRYKYASSKNKSNSAAQDITRLRSIFKEGAYGIDIAVNLVIIKCYAGMAQAVCAAVDASDSVSIVGTLAGDDTIFIAVRSEEQAVLLVNEFQKLLNS